MVRLSGVITLFSVLFFACQPQPAQAEELVQHFGDSQRISYKRLDLYLLKGDAHKIGEAAGHLAPANSFKTGSGMVPFMMTYVENLVKHQDFVMRHPWIARMISPFLEWRYYRTMRGNITPEARSYIDGLALSSGLNAHELDRAFLNPDLVLSVIADDLQGRLMPFASEYAFLSSMPHAPVGCATVVVPPELSADGRMIFGRVQDYPGVGLFDAHPSVFLVAKPGKYRYIHITTAGIATGGITAMNEHGLTMSWHSGVSYRTEINNTPGLITTGEMIEGARTIEEAAAICNRHVPVAGWIMNLADTATGHPRTAWIEVDPASRQCLMRFAENGHTFANTNHFRILENVPNEIRAVPGIDMNTNDRLQRLEQLLTLATARRRGRATVQDVIKMLSDRYDPRLGRYLGYGPSVISATDQIVAAIFRPETKEVYVSNGYSPTASNGQYVRLSFDDFDRLAVLAAEERERNAQGRIGLVDQARGDMDAIEILSGTPNDPAQWPAYTHLLQATLVSNPHGTVDTTSALGHLNDAVAAEPLEPTLHFLRGLLLMSMGRPAESLADLTLAITPPEALLTLDPHRKAIARLQLAKANDALGQRRLALQGYAETLADPLAHHRVKLAAEKFTRVPATTEDLTRAKPDLKYMDTMAYD